MTLLNKARILLFFSAQILSNDVREKVFACFGIEKIVQF